MTKTGEYKADQTTAVEQMTRWRLMPACALLRQGHVLPTNHQAGVDRGEQQSRPQTDQEQWELQMVTRIHCYEADLLVLRVESGAKPVNTPLLSSPVTSGRLASMSATGKYMQQLK